MDQLLSLRYVAAGGVVGTALRWATVTIVSDHRTDEAILALNVVGSILLGVVLGRKRPRRGRPRITRNQELLLGTGFCASLTTFATYTLDVATALDDGQIGEAAITAVTTVAAAVLGAGLGYRIGARS